MMSARLPLSYAQFDAVQPEIRPLTADDSKAYRALRKRILAIGDGKYFSDSYIRERRFVTERQWREWCTETQEHCTIGTFVNGNLIGIMGIIAYGAPENLAVEWEATWLDPQYRRFGVARLAYEKVQQWTKDHGYEYAVVFIRDDNARSREIREKQGALYVSTKRGDVWADGSVADAHCFVLELFPANLAQTAHYDRAIHSLEKTLSFLN